MATDREPPKENLAHGAPQGEVRDPLRALRPPVRPWFVALVLNVALGAALIGFPWWRGRTRAEMSIHAYVEYAACLHGGMVRSAPGLALPEGNRERFAALYLHAVPEWPASCRDALSRVPRDEALLLLPGAKTGEAEVRVATIGAEAALDVLIEARQSARAPQIPRAALRTLDHLAAAMSVLVEETGVTIAPEHLAFDLGDGASLVTPSRVPLQTASGGPLYVTAVEGGGLRAVSADSRSIAIVAVHDGSIDITQVRRPAAARAIIDDGHTTYLGWVTGDSTCAREEAHCANRLTGLALVRDDVDSPAPEVWIAAHPALSLALSFVLDGTSLSVIAREADDTISLRRIALPEPWPAASADAPSEAPRAATDTLPLGAATDVVVIDGRAIANDHGATLLTCGARVIEIERGHVNVGATASFDAEPGPPVRGTDPLDDHARCAVAASGVSFAWIDRVGGLHLVADVDDPHDQLIAERIAGFAMTRTGETVVFATWGEDGERQVTLRRVWHGRVLASDVAAACWDDGAGLCGPAGIASTGSETLLYAREGSDLRVLRVTGATLAALPGLGDR